MSSESISQSKTICILAIVVGCFAVLWPSLFYPMLKGSFGPQSHTAGCCDVMSSMDMSIVKIIMDVCDRVVEKTDKKTNLELCSQEIFNTCAINITDLVSGNQVGYVSYKKHIFSEIRSLNGSLCLKYHYGVPLASLGVPHRLKDYDPLTNHIPQERTPVHLRASKATMHPALLEKGRAIPPPQPHIGPRHHGIPTPHSFKPPIPGSRPPMGGLGGINHNTGGSDGSTMNILMPMYTIGIILFFVYTMMKLLTKKDDNDENTQDRLPFQYSSAKNSRATDLKRLSKKKPQNILPQKLGCVEKDTRDLEIDALRRKLEETEAAMERIVKQMILASECNGMDGNKEVENDKQGVEKYPAHTISDENQDCVDDQINVKTVSQSTKTESINSSNTSELQEEQTIDSEIHGKKIIQVVNMETSESIDGGHCWTPVEKEKTPSKGKTTPIEEPISLLIPGTIPKNSQVLVSDGPHNIPFETEDHEAVISSKVTLSLIPDDRLEEYMSSEETEDNATSTVKS